jgi:hypothetical protein
LPCSWPLRQGQTKTCPAHILIIRHAEKPEGDKSVSLSTRGKDAKKKTGKSKNRRMQEANALHLRHVRRVYPRNKHNEVVLRIDNAPRHGGKPVDKVMAENPHLKFKRLPSYRPQLNPVERFWIGDGTGTLIAWRYHGKSGNFFILLSHFARKMRFR